MLKVLDLSQPSQRWQGDPFLGFDYGFMLPNGVSFLSGT